MNPFNTKPCEEHPNFALTFLCTHESCKRLLCAECIYPHCKDHEMNKTFPEIRSTESVKQNISESISVCLKSLYQVLENISLSSSDKIMKNLSLAEDEVISLVEKFFKAKREEAHSKLESIQQATTTDNESSQLRTSLNDRIFAYEKMNSEVNDGYLDVYVLQKIACRNFENELNEVLEEISTQTEPIKLWKSENLAVSLRKVLDTSFMIGERSNQMIFTPDKTESDLEILPGKHVTIKKKGEKNHPSICLGPCLNKGIHTFTVRIDELAGNQFGAFQGWVGLGLTENESINLTTSNYVSAVCICSDQSFYKVHVTQTGQVTVGGVYTFEVNFGTGEINITGENGLACKAEGYQGKSLYPYFEFTSKHQITIMNYTTSK